MGIEIEKKFLIDLNKINLDDKEKTVFMQGYLTSDNVEDIKYDYYADEIKIIFKDKSFVFDVDFFDSEVLEREYFGYDNSFIFALNNVFRIRLVKIIRDSKEFEEAILTIKGETIGISRLEFECNIDVSIAKEILNKLPIIIEKTRYEHVENDKCWEIDIFEGDNKGLVVAELELKSEFERFKKPDWILEEVSLDPKYYNNNLLNNPYKNWKG